VAEAGKAKIAARRKELEGMSDWRERDRDQLERHLEHELKKRGLTRRDLMKGGMGMAAALGLGSLFAACGGDGGGEAAPPAAEPPAGEPAPPAEEAPAFTGTLRVLGLGVDLQAADGRPGAQPGAPIAEEAEKALGFKVQFTVKTTTENQQIVLTQPDSFDVYSGYHHEYDRLWQSGNLQPVEIAKIELWNEIGTLHTLGKVDPASTTCTVGDGDAPVTKLYVDPDQTGTWATSPETNAENEGVIVQWADLEASPVAGVGEEPKFTTGVPQNFNMDSMGYNQDVIQLEPDQVSWAELFNQSYRGRVALLADPSIALQDAGNAALATGLIDSFGSLGNMTREEMDAMFTILTDLKQQGHFKAFWGDFNESVNLMASGEVVIESMWSPAVALLVTQGLNVRYAAPPEGFRGWSAGQAISTSVTDPATLQAAYDYINWWLTGLPGSLTMRQGYYLAVQERTREFVEPEEWDFWIEGQPAAKDLPGITGQVGDVKQGTVRDGGSFVDRACRYSSWNSFPQETEYMTQRWNEFQAA
jgi:putative spermidine/putrescine transport system substrate-binding protein